MSLNARTVGIVGPWNLRLHHSVELAHCLLFLLEFGANSTDKEVMRHKRNLQVFLSHAGGLHLLLLLINAHYTKPLTGRRPGWTFGTLEDRIRISRRGLRMLISNLVSEGLIEKLPGIRDHRKRLYCLTPLAVEAWEALTNRLGGSLTGVLATFGPDYLANVDYRSWNPDTPAHAQLPALTPNQLRHAKTIQPREAPSFRGWSDSVDRRRTMGRRSFSEEQIIGILKEQEAGLSAAGICRKYGVSDATLYKWRSRFGDSDVSVASELEALQEENRRLKVLLAESMPDVSPLRDLLEKNVRRARPGNHQ